MKSKHFIKQKTYIHEEITYRAFLTKKRCVAVSVVKAHKGISGEICIPSSIHIEPYLDPCKVTKIENSAFANRNSLTSIVIPDSVTEIGKSAFADCKSLTQITIGKNVKKIGNYAFVNCGSLTSVVIPNSVTEIGERVF